MCKELSKSLAKQAESRCYCEQILRRQAVATNGVSMHGDEDEPLPKVPSLQAVTGAQI